MPTFLASLTRSANLLGRRVEQYIVETGLSANELLVMTLAILNPSATAAQIRAELGMRQSTFTSLVDRLIGRGYLTTRPSPLDRRTRYLVPTRPGRQAARIGREIQLELEAQAWPVGHLVVLDGLDRLGFLAALIEPPFLLEDGLPEVTA